jgi:muramidase (phage lysozyme)
LPYAEAQAPLQTQEQIRKAHEQMIRALEPKNYALYLVKNQWSNAKREFACLDLLWQKESNWRSTAANPHSTAFGIPQFLNSTWVNYGYPIRPKDPQIQIKAGLRYIYKRYDTPCGAWEFWKRQAGKDLHGGWY